MKLFSSPHKFLVKRYLVNPYEGAGFIFLPHKYGHICEGEKEPGSLITTFRN